MPEISIRWAKAITKGGGPVAVHHTGPRTARGGERPKLYVLALHTIWCRA